jgi:hypothetical protein
LKSKGGQTQYHRQHQEIVSGNHGAAVVDGVHEKFDVGDLVGIVGPVRDIGPSIFCRNPDTPQQNLTEYSIHDVSHS